MIARFSFDVLLTGGVEVQVEADTEKAVEAARAEIVKKLDAFVESLRLEGITHADTVVEPAEVVSDPEDFEFRGCSNIERRTP